MCWGPYISWCMLPGWWFNVWETWGGGFQVNWDCWPFYMVTLLLSFFQLFPNSTTGVSRFCSLVGCKYLHLSLSAACWVFREAVMVVPLLWAHHSLSNSVRSWGLPLSWIQIWACCQFSFSSGSSPFLSLYVLISRTRTLWVLQANSAVLFHSSSSSI